MSQRILALAITADTDIIVARQRTRTVTSLLGFDAQDQNRITTALSEIVRNALEYGQGGRVEYAVLPGTPQALQITVIDKGPGIRDVDAILSGRHVSTTGMGIGITGARRLMDEFTITSQPGKGTTVTMAKRLSRRAPAVTAAILNKVADGLVVQGKVDPISEVRRQNQETMLQFQELQKRQEELEILNQELSDTNRGVVALYAELEERADHLRRADQLKTRFLSNMSHEFRTPLNSILSLARLLLARIDGPLSPEQEKQVQFIRTGAETLSDLVNDLLDLARVEAGKTVIVAKEFNVADLFGALRGMLRPILVTETVELVFDAPEDLPLMYTDEGKLSQILRNFISNAIKFTEKGEVRVWAAYDPDAATMTFSVRDTGVGIAEKDINTVWEEFGQVANKLQGRAKGTGLGLPLSRKLAVLLGGDVGLESALGTGSIFHVTLPRVYRAKDIQSVAQQWTLDPARLPVVSLEDNPADSFSLERILTHTKYQLISTRTVEETKAVLAQVTPAAVVLDVVLEGEESWRILIELKQNERTHHIPVVVVSSSEEERKARGFGADEYLGKPVDAARVVEVLDTLTGANTTINVLVVDDDEVSRYLMRQLLPRGAFSLTEAANAEDGLSMAASQKPDLILLDLDMHGVNGYEFLQRITGDAELKDIPVVVASAMVMDETIKSRLTGAAGILSKYDLSTDVLVSAIHAAVNEHGNRAA